jgi:hypothetical protein
MEQEEVKANGIASLKRQITCPLIAQWPKSYYSELIKRLHKQHLSEHPEIRCECRGE